MILPHLERARKIAYKFLDESAGRDRAAKAIASQFLLVAQEERERAAKIADQAVIDGGVDASWIASAIRQQDQIGGGKSG